MKIEKITAKEYNLQQINSIKKKYPELRQMSKGPTFALTYQGNWRTLMTKFGFDEDQAKRIEARYHELYADADKWVQDRLHQAEIDGYVTCAFGLRLRTPLLKSCVMHSKNTIKEAEKEARSAGNALGQSWCLLNTRSALEVLHEVWRSKYATDILPCAQIHDALYFFVKDDLEVITWFNKVLIKAMEWQEDPMIKHDKVKLGGDMEIHYPSWAEGIEIKNNATKEEIRETLKNAISNK